MEKSGSGVKEPDSTGGGRPLQEGLEDSEKLLQHTNALRIRICDREEEVSCGALKKPDQQGRSE
jgi:hypothetical protein